MATYHKQNPNANKKKVSISFVIREKEEPLHRAGVNSLQYDSYLDRLYSAGRDSVIRIWNLACEQDEPSPSYRDPNGFAKPMRRSTNENYYSRSMEHHTDWVNDIILCCNGRNLISVSNDTTIKVWSAHQGFCLSTLRSHKDYAKCLAYAKDKEVVASAGFDRMIYLWDIQALTMLTATKNTVTTRPLDGSKDSIYSLAINQSGTLVASGSTEKLIRLWDPRTRQKLLKLRGHTDNVRSLLFSKDGSSLLSAGSDGTVRLWSISQQRCISIIRVHDEGVWTLQTNEAFSTVFSGGKDGKIFLTSLKETSNSELVCQESAPILKMVLVDKGYGRHRETNSPSLWVATTDSSLKNWPVNNPEGLMNPDMNHQSEQKKENARDAKPDVVIRGNPAVINYHIANDKRHIITRESDFSVAIYDVLTARKLRVLHPPSDEQTSKTNYELEIKKHTKMVYVPNWFTVDLKIGLLCIHLEESECFSAWVSAKDYGFITQVDGQDPKVNLGCLMLQALLEHWPSSYDHHELDPRSLSNELRLENSSLDDHNTYSGQKPSDLSLRYKSLTLDRANASGNPLRVGNQYFSVASHTPIIISEGNQTILRFMAVEASNESEDIIIQDVVPHWISDAVISRCQPKFNKIPFFLLPHANSGIKSLRKERLSASDMLQMRKVIEHVCEKMIVNILEENGAASQEHATNLKSANVSGKSSPFPIDKVELFCNDQKLDDNLDLRTVKHYIWKSGGDLILHYMPIK